jgi:hypothetical protein
MLREVIIPHERRYVLSIPPEYLHRTVEILVLPFDENIPRQADTSQEFRLTTFRCGGKRRDFTRGDAYRDSL